MVTRVARHMSGRLTMADQESRVKPTGQRVTEFVLTAMFGSASKVQDRIDFEKRFEREVVKRHVLDHSKMDEVDYDALARVELYLLPQDALKRGFIDEIITDIDTIL